MRGSEQLLVGVGLLAIVIILAITIASGRLELAPVTVLGSVTCIISYAAYRFSREKLRLDLFEKRWEIYEETLKFCSAVTQHGTLTAREDNKEQIASALKSAHSSFRGIGIHKTNALFGPEIQTLFAKLNESYSWLVAYSERPRHTDEYKNWAQDRSKHLKFMWETVQMLPSVFKPYMYFGDVRNDFTLR